MGLIDVSDIVGDPDFVERIAIIHRMTVMNAYGENILRENSVPAFGCVQPASGKTLQRLPEAMRVANVMSFWVKGPIVSDGTAQYPDILLYRGNRYAVQVILDWTTWGAGWAEGTCIREKPTL